METFIQLSAAIRAGREKQKGEDTMKMPIWKPSEEVTKRANITRFMSFVNKKYGLTIESYGELYDWSIEKLPDF
jgi:hypothetical protein